MTIASIPCHFMKFAFTDQNNNIVNVIWSCRQPPPPPLPPLKVYPTRISNLTGSLCTFNSTTVSCTITEMETPNSQGNLNWSARSSLSGVTFSPQNGTLSPGQSVQVTISNLPYVNGTFTFSSGANPGTVSAPLCWLPARSRFRASVIVY